MNCDFSRFIKAQELDYQIALAEIRRGRKTSHWIWYIFPQVLGLGRSATAIYYALRDMDEVRAYLADPLLGSRLIEICEALLSLDTNDAAEVMGSGTDVWKLQSSMTIFDEATDSLDIFQRVLDKFYHGKKDNYTLNKLSQLQSADGQLNQFD